MTSQTITRPHPDPHIRMGQVLGHSRVSAQDGAAETHLRNLRALNLAAYAAAKSARAAGSPDATDLRDIALRTDTLLEGL